MCYDLILTVLFIRCHRFSSLGRLFGGGEGLLAYVNLLLTVYGGAALATAARLKWDPSTYVVLRELLPQEYVALVAACTVTGVLFILLPLLAITALHAPSRSAARILLYFYSAMLTVLGVMELVFGIWLLQRLLAWLMSDVALHLREALKLRKMVGPILKFFVPQLRQIDAVIQESLDDAPRNLYVLIGCVLLLAALQPLAVALAVSVARCRRRPAFPQLNTPMTSKTRLPNRKC